MNGPFEPRDAGDISEVIAQGVVSGLQNGHRNTTVNIDVPSDGMMRRPFRPHTEPGEA